MCSMLLVTLSASVDLLQSHNFLSSFAASLDSTGVILTGLAPAIYMQRIVEMGSNKKSDVCRKRLIIFSSCEHYCCVATFLVGSGIYTRDLKGHESGINSYDGSGSMTEVEAQWKWKHDRSGKWK